MQDRAQHTATKRKVGISLLTVHCQAVKANDDGRLGREARACMRFLDR
jgi:hypothetical protein